MPLYEYQCDVCEHRFEVIQKYSDPLVSVCPKCGGVVQKLLSSPAIQFKGSGFYLTDYGRGGKSDSSGTKGKNSEGGASGSDTGKASDGASSSKGEAGSSESKSDSKPKSDSKSDSKSESKSETKPAPPASSKPE